MYVVLIHKNLRVCTERDRERDAYPAKRDVMMMNMAVLYALRMEAQHATVN